MIEIISKYDLSFYISEGKMLPLENSQQLFGDTGIAFK